MRESKALVFGEMFCRKCGEKYNDDGDLFCTLCGSQRRTEGKTNNAAESQSQSSKETRETKTLQQSMAGKKKDADFSIGKGSNNSIIPLENPQNAPATVES